METEKTYAAEICIAALHRDEKIRLIKEMADNADDVTIDIILTILK